MLTSCKEQLGTLKEGRASASQPLPTRPQPPRYSLLATVHWPLPSLLTLDVFASTVKLWESPSAAPSPEREGDNTSIARMDAR